MNTRICLIFTLLALLAVSGCTTATVVHTYPGPPKASSEVALIEGRSDPRKRSRQVWPQRVNGRAVNNFWDASPADAYCLPGQVSIGFGGADNTYAFQVAGGHRYRLGFMRFVTQGDRVLSPGEASLEVAKRAGAGPTDEFNLQRHFAGELMANEYINVRSAESRKIFSEYTKMWRPVLADTGTGSVQPPSGDPLAARAFSVVRKTAERSTYTDDRESRESDAEIRELIQNIRRK